MAEEKRAKQSQLAAIPLETQITNILKEAENPLTAKEICTQVKKKYGIEITKHEINQVLFNSQIFEKHPPASGVAPGWLLKNDKEEQPPTFSCDVFSVNILEEYEHAQSMIKDILAVLKKYSITEISCDTNTEEGKIAKKTAKELKIAVV